jgi:hypothetical protein
MPAKMRHPSGWTCQLALCGFPVAIADIVLAQLLSRFMQAGAPMVQASNRSVGCCPLLAIVAPTRLR